MIDKNITLRLISIPAIIYPLTIILKENCILKGFDDAKYRGKINKTHSNYNELKKSKTKNKINKNLLGLSQF